MVTRGQFLLQIDAQQAEAGVQRMEASLASSKAQMAQAQANLLQAQRSLERTAQIKKTNPTLISDEQMEQLRQEAEQYSWAKVTEAVLDIYTAVLGRATRE